MTSPPEYGHGLVKRLRYLAVGPLPESATATVRAGADEIVRLRQGRPYSTNVARGVVRLSRKAGDTTFAYILDVPQNYDPARKYQVRVQLHGGVARPDPTPRGNGIAR